MNSKETLGRPRASMSAILIWAELYQSASPAGRIHSSRPNRSDPGEGEQALWRSQTAARAWRAAETFQVSAHIFTARRASLRRLGSCAARRDARAAPAPGAGWRPSDRAAEP